MSAPDRPLRVGTRGSALALAQAAWVAERLPEPAELVTIRTSGDRREGVGDKARWVKELEAALMAGEVDLAVHSAKDVPGELPDGLMIGGVPERADPRDALVGASAVEALPEGARIGTSSLRRAAQLRAARRDVEIVELRGNVDTRLGRLASGDADALLLACAGLARLGRDGRTPLDPGVFVPAPGQGCLALEVRAGDERALRAVRAVEDPAAATALAAERECVVLMEATCETPVGAHAALEGSRLVLTAWAGTPDGLEWVRDRATGSPDRPERLGREVAERMLAGGASEILDQVEAGRR